jgi:hypothetical protein
LVIQPLVQKGEKYVFPGAGLPDFFLLDFVIQFSSSFPSFGWKFVKMPFVTRRRWMGRMNG